MSLNLRWVGRDEIDRVAEARLLSYGRGRNELERYREELLAEPRTGPGDWLLAQRGGEVVGTATSLGLTMWARGGAVKCQGVAFVGTVKTARRGFRIQGSESKGQGVGTAVMNEMLRAARERGFVVSALMPFRGSYYEHFGYGFVERRAAWMVPLDLISEGDFSSVRFYRDGDLDELVKCKQRVTQNGQCDIERPVAMWERYLRSHEDGFVVVDRQADGPIRGWMTFQSQHHDGLDTVRAFFDTGWEDIPALRRLLYFLGSLRDQYRFAAIQLPADLRLDLLLKEHQMTHRVSKNHPNAEVKPFNRMQVRVLDHAKFLEALRWPAHARGRAVVAVHEPEGNVAKFAIDAENGRATAKPSDSSADLECRASTWAAVACGDLRASSARDLGLLEMNSNRIIGILDALAEGPAPFCREYF